MYQDEECILLVQPLSLHIKLLATGSESKGKMSQEGCDFKKILEKALQKMPTLGKYVAMRIKKTLSIVYLLLIALMALGTIVGKYTSVEMAADQFFGAWWFTLLWAVGVALGVA